MGLNDRAWEQLFDKYHILDEISNNGSFTISAEQIKEFREPRLMTKFDHKVNLPKVFADNGLAILPITRGDYAGFTLQELIIKGQHNCRSTGYWKASNSRQHFLLLAHEHLFVFKKKVKLNLI